MGRKGWKARKKSPAPENLWREKHMEKKQWSYNRFPWVYRWGAKGGGKKKDQEYGFLTCSPDLQEAKSQRGDRRNRGIPTRRVHQKVAVGALPQRQQPF